MKKLVLLFVSVILFSACGTAIPAPEVNKSANSSATSSSAQVQQEENESIDTDGDGILDDQDNCPNDSNPDQKDTDSDGLGDLCDICANDANNDSDEDGTCGDVDNCQLLANPDQGDADLDGAGNACDDEDDNDGFADDADNCPLIANPNQTDTNGDSVGDACQGDDDGDGIVDQDDNCRILSNSDQIDLDKDGVGDVCDDVVTDLHFSLSGAKVLVLREQSADVVSSSGVAFKTNFFIVNESDNMVPAVDPSIGYEGKTIEIKRLDVTSTDNLYILLYRSYIINGIPCTWYSVDLQTLDISCIGNEEISEVEFSNNGDIYFRNPSGDGGMDRNIKKYDKVTGEITAVFSGESFGFRMSEFLPADDGSIFVLGQLEGTTHHFFRFFPASLFGEDSLEAQCMQGLVASPDDLMYLLDDGSFYVKTNGSPMICDNMERREIYRGTINEAGEVTFEGLPDNIYAVSFAEDLQHHLYAVGNARFNGNWNTVTRIDAEPYDSTFMSLSESPLFGLKGDYIFAAGMNGSLVRVFLRKHLFGEQEEVDLLGGNDLSVDKYDITPSGNVYFSAYDDNASEYNLYKYNNLATSLDVIGELSERLKDIICLEN